MTINGTTFPDAAELERLIEAEQRRYRLTGPDKRGLYWVQWDEDRRRNGWGAQTERERRRELSHQIATAVLKRLGVEGWDEWDGFDWRRPLLRGPLALTKAVLAMAAVRSAALSARPVAEMFDAAPVVVGYEVRP